MSKWIKIPLLLLALLVLAIFIAGWAAHQPLPQGESGPAADALARKMETALDKAAWDTTRYVSWSFRDVHHYVWDRRTDWVEVRWDNYRVLLHTPDRTGRVFENGEEITDVAAAALLQSAWQFFANDSFWLVAPFKAFDPGTTRQVVTLEDGEAALLVRYTSGGVTPGDAYLWLLEPDGRPRAWRMWVGIMPIGGLEIGWSGWQTTATGAVLAGTHPAALFDLELTDIRAGQTLAAIDVASDPFAEE